MVDLFKQEMLLMTNIVLPYQVVLSWRASAFTLTGGSLLLGIADYNYIYMYVLLHQPTRMYTT